jgi:simple sugar transport system permease protein
MSTADDWRSRVRAVLVRLADASGTERLALSLAALGLSIVVGTLLILVAGRVATCQTAAFTLTHPTPFGLPRLFAVGFCFDPIQVFDRLFLGALGDPIEEGWQFVTFGLDPFVFYFDLNPFAAGYSPLNSQMAVTLRQTTVLVFTGLSVAIAFKAGIFNIGSQGQLIAGGLATGLTVFAAQGPVVGLLGEGLLTTLVLVPLGVLVGALFGGAYGAIPGALKAYAEANEVITTIMLNFVATGVTFYLVSTYFRDPSSQAVQTRSLLPAAQFPPILYEARDDFSVVALLFGLLLMGALYYLLEYTSFGYDVRTSGIQPQAAEYGGVDAERTIVASMALSGAFAGIGGAVYVMMILGRYQTGVPAFGFDGITVSILAGNNPLGVGIAAFLFGTLKSGATVVQFATDVPPQLVAVLRGLIILFVAMPEFFRLIGRRITPKRERQGAGAVAADGGTLAGGEPDE